MKALDGLRWLDAGELLSARDALAHLESVKSFSREMAVEREEFQAVTDCMAQNHERTVIEGRSIDRRGVNDAAKWRVDRCARRSEQIYPEMNGAALMGWVFAGSKKWRSVEQARFVVAADANEGFGALHLAEDRLAEVFRF